MQKKDSGKPGSPGRFFRRANLRCHRFGRLQLLLRDYNSGHHHPAWSTWWLFHPRRMFGRIPGKWRCEWTQFARPPCALPDWRLPAHSSHAPVRARGPLCRQNREPPSSAIGMRRWSLQSGRHIFCCCMSGIQKTRLQERSYGPSRDSQRRSDQPARPLCAGSRRCRSDQPARPPYAGSRRR
jgi:hypothetical protein